MTVFRLSNMEELNIFRIHQLVSLFNDASLYFETEFKDFKLAENINAKVQWLVSSHTF
jgi:hypothetical protein